MKSILTVFVFIMLIYSISASLGTFKLNDCVQIRVLANCSDVNITEVSNSQETYILNVPMSNLGGQTFNYTFCNTSLLGTYSYSWNNPCIDCSYGDCGNSFEITPTGTILTMTQIYIYLFFLMLCLVLTFFSVRLFKNNKYSKSEQKYSELYQTKKRNEFIYYMTLLKRYMWIIGLFGIYFSILIFVAILNQLVYNLGLSDLDNMLQYVVLFLAWGLIPFTLFWFVWLIIVFYKSTTEIMRYQFGNIRGGK